MFPDALSKPHPEVLSLEEHSKIAAVKEPPLTAKWIGANKMRIQYSGQPRAWATLLFTNLLADLLKSDKRPPGIVLLEVLTYSSVNTASATYLFSHEAGDNAALQEFADNLLAKFTERAVDLPRPTDGLDFQLTVLADPDRENQLNDVLTFFKEKARGYQTINLVALNGCRHYVGKGPKGHIFHADLRLILTIPEEYMGLADPDSMKAKAARLKLEAELKKYGEARGVSGEQWEVDLRPFEGHFMDVPTAIRPMADIEKTAPEAHPLSAND